MAHAHVRHIKIPYFNTSIEDDIINTIYLIPLWWITGLSIIIYHVLSVFFFIKLLAICSINGKRVSIPLSVIPLLFFIITYISSLLINWHSNELFRTFASLYNFSFWLIGLLLIITVYNTFSYNSVSRFLSGIKYNMFVIGTISLVAIILWYAGLHLIKIPTLLARYTHTPDDTALLQASTTMSIIRTDWFASVKFPRLSIMSPYPTALAGIILIMILFILYCKGWENKKVLMLYLLASGFVTLFFALSRSSFVGLIVSIFSVFIIKRYNKAPLVIIFLIILCLFGTEIFKWFQYLFNLREGSNIARIDMYNYSLKSVLNSNIMFGFGVKPREYFFSIPIGSHSTYLSIFIRTGALGLISLVFFNISIFFTWLRSRKTTLIKQARLWEALGAIFIATTIWSITEDIDAPQLFAFLYFIVIGLMLSFEKIATNR
jgi:hypothetical protein